MTDDQAALKAEGTDMPEPCLGNLQYALYGPSMLRLALNTLHCQMPPEWTADSAVRETLNGMRAKLEELELEGIRMLGHQEYLLIKPLAPYIGGAFAEKAAEHVRALDDLGLVVRLD